MAANIDFSGWTAATGNLTWGVQRVMRDTLGLVAEGKVRLVFGRNYSKGSPCLVNAVAQMLTLDENGVSPAGWFPEVVQAFDHVNALLVTEGVNNDGEYVTPLAAEILLKHFGAIKPVPTEADYAEEAARELSAQIEAMPYHEPSDAEFADMLAAMDTVPAPVDEPATDSGDHSIHG